MKKHYNVMTWRGGYFLCSNFLQADDESEAIEKGIIQAINDDKIYYTSDEDALTYYNDLTDEEREDYEDYYDYFMSDDYTYIDEEDLKGFVFIRHLRIEEVDESEYNEYKEA